MAIRVVIADDHGMVHGRLSRYLASTPDIEVVATSTCTSKTIAAVDEQRPDVAVLDIDMPGMVFAAARQLKARHPEMRLLILSGFLHDHYLEQALAVRASGYLTRSEPLDRVVEAIRQVARGATYFSREVRARLVFDSMGARLAVPLAVRANLLSPRERDVLRYVARGLSNKEIGACLHRSYRTVDHHLARMMEKLAIHSRVSLAQFAVREGIAEP
jgi:DNA-binding NarL/FixJ family response regulator